MLGVFTETSRMALPAKGEYPDSKLTEALAQTIRAQLKARASVRSWEVIAGEHDISLRNLLRHVRKLRGRA